MNEKINLLIPCAGLSKRFYNSGYKTHKAFLPLNQGRNVLEVILSGFDNNIFKPYIVFTYKQQEENQEKLLKLREKFPSLEVITIKEHNLGPTYTLSFLELEEKAPVVVHYCDFITRFNHHSLINDISNGYLSAPFFKGFHPASLGTTNFAYMKVDSTGKLINLQEKQPFTKNRIQEPASTGIYGFPTFKEFKLLTQSLLSKQADWGLPEAYTSLLLNEAIDKGFTVNCSEVKNFICLGTPRDYEEYIFWNKLHEKYNQNIISTKQELITSEHLITAAGKGSRFSNENYRLPKIFNNLEGKTLIEHSYISLPEMKTHLLTLDHYKNYIMLLLKALNINLEYIDKTPPGQLLSLLELVKLIKPKYDFFVSSADYRFRIDSKIFKSFITRNNPDIVIFTTPWNSYAFNTVSNYGFVDTSEKDQVLKIVEKPEAEINPSMLVNLLIGTFWFKSKSIVESLPISKNVNNETFIASSIGNNLKDYRVYKFTVDYWLSLGTPKELDLAKYWLDFFNNDQDL